MAWLDKNLTLSLIFNPEGQAPDVLIDPLRFKQILTNLISNAIKFTERGQVTLELNVQPADTPGQVELHLSVKDTGIGISQNDQARLFEPFAQVENSGQLALNGAGLGLVICRSLCEMMGGTLELSSQPNVGTRIQITLEVPSLKPCLSATTHMPEITLATRPLNVLVVDDHPANRLLMCQQLAFLGHRFTTAPNGAAGLKAWKEERFDLVIADCNMPVMNGYDLTQAIRQHEQATQRQSCTVLGFTANAQPEERQRCRQAGMDDCLFKPISLTLLSQCLNGLEPPAPVPEAFNIESLYALSGGDESGVKRLLEELLRSNRQDLKALLGMDVNDGLQPIVEIAHRIKGAARIVGAHVLIEHCEVVEQASLSTLPPCLIELQHAMESLDQALSNELAKLSGAI